MSETRGSQVRDLVRRMRAAVEGLAEAPVWGMVGTELAETLTDLGALRGELDELELRLVAHAERTGVITVPGPHEQTRQHTDPVAWWGRATCQDRRTTVVRARLAAALDATGGAGSPGARVACREAMTRGHLSEAQALVIDRALAEIEAGWTGVDGQRREVPAEVVALCEKHLVAAAEDHSPRQLRFLGKHVLERVAPEIADDQLRRVIESEERRAAQRCRLEMWDDGHGTTYGRFQIPTVDGAALRKYLLAFNAPKHRTALGEPVIATRKPTAQQMGEAFCELIQRYPADRLPDAGGITARLVETMTLDQLLGHGDGADRPVATDMDELMPAAQARKWACEAQIIPQVLGGDSVVLDQGRATRFHTGAQRTAIATRDRCCTVQGCDVPPGLCQVHHDHPWSAGGHTSVVDGRLLCPLHHRQIHDPRHAVTRVGNGKIVITRR